LAHKAEHAVDMESGAVIAVTLQPADQGDTTTIRETLAEVAEILAQLIEREIDEPKPQVSLHPLVEVVADRGYRSGATGRRSRWGRTPGLAAVRARSALNIHRIEGGAELCAGIG